ELEPLAESFGGSKIHGMVIRVESLNLGTDDREVGIPTHAPRREELPPVGKDRRDRGVDVAHPEEVDATVADITQRQDGPESHLPLDVQIVLERIDRTEI